MILEYISLMRLLLILMNADNIYVLDKGSVVEYGKHEDLLKKNGVYKNLWTSQQELEKYVGGK